MNSSYQDPIRNNCALKFDHILKDECLSREIEKHIFNHILKMCKKRIIYRSWKNNTFKNLYLSKIRSIYSNLKEDSYIHNKNFKEKVLNKEIIPEEIPKLPAYDICPENWKEIIELKTKRDKLKYDLKPEAMTDMFKCHKCGSRSCSYYEMQTRSADEPMTQFITCLDCGNHWRQ
jgi:transcription elongation factor S-II